MDKKNRGFTLFEILMGLGVVAMLALIGIPGMNAMLDKHVLKSKVSRLDSHIEKARHLAAITECPVSLALEPENGNVNVDVKVELDTFMKGCSAWHAQTPEVEDQGFAARLENLSLDQSVTLRFQAISGVLDTSSFMRFNLKYREIQAVIHYMGIGDGVVHYE